jgi:hypothetical protein
MSGVTASGHAAPVNSESVSQHIARPAQGARRKIMSGRFFAVLISSLSVWPALGQPAPFVDVSAQRGIGPFQSEAGRGAGAAADDYDGDGDVDIFAPQAAGLPHLLYRNLGDGTFEEIAGQVGLGSTMSGRNALWFDYDGDGDQDLLVANDDLVNASSLTLYRQDSSGQFEDVTVAAGMWTPPNCYIPGCPNYHWAGICAGDINNDGYLDVYTAQYLPGPAHLFLNTGRGSFQNIGASSGVGVYAPQDPHFLHQSVMADFNKDGWIDIYVAVDVGANGGDPNHLWINQQDNTFEDMAPQAGLDNAMDDMGIALGDYDNDGDLDVYVTNIFHDGEHNVLFRNDSVAGQLDFTEVSFALGVAEGGWGWGTTFMDIDLDGDLDLAATNGWRSGKWTSDPSRFFTNLGGTFQAFADHSDEVDFNDTDWGSALVAADFDRDGDLDLLQACVTFYDNVTGLPTQFGPLRLRDNPQRQEGPPNHYLVVQPRQPGPNHRAIGAVVHVEAGGRSMMRLITAGTSYLGQEPAEAFFGLGTAALADTVTVQWPDGDTSTVQNVAADQILTIRHCSELGDCADLDGDGLRDDNCVWWACQDGACADTGIVFADMGGSNGACMADGAADGNDRFHALNCFSNTNTMGGAGYPCESQPPSALNVDAGGPFGSCSPDGVCDGNDAFHALNAFSNVSTCSCPAGGPSPEAVSGRSRGR